MEPFSQEGNNKDLNVEGSGVDGNVDIARKEFKRPVNQHSLFYKARGVFVAAQV